MDFARGLREDRSAVSSAIRERQRIVHQRIAGGGQPGRDMDVDRDLHDLFHLGAMEQDLAWLQALLDARSALTASVQLPDWIVPLLPQQHRVVLQMRKSNKTWGQIAAQLDASVRRVREMYRLLVRFSRLIPAIANTAGVSGPSDREIAQALDLPTWCVRLAREHAPPPSKAPPPPTRGWPSRPERGYARVPISDPAAPKAPYLPPSPGSLQLGRRSAEGEAVAADGAWYLLRAAPGKALLVKAEIEMRWPIRCLAISRTPAERVRGDPKNPKPWLAWTDVLAVYLRPGDTLDPDELHDCWGWVGPTNLTTGPRGRRARSAPHPVPEWQLRQWFKSCGWTHLPDEPAAPVKDLTQGQRVRVEAGALAGWEGVCLSGAREGWVRVRVAGKTVKLAELTLVPVE